MAQAKITINGRTTTLTGDEAATFIERFAAEMEAGSASPIAKAIDHTSRVLALNALEDLSKAYSKHRRWLDAVTAHIAGDQHALDGLRCPSKAHKHRMYAHADRVHRCLQLDGERPHTMEGIAALIADAHLVLAELAAADR